MCVDVESLEVVDVEGPNAWHTNASVHHFARCAEVVLSRLPFYSRDAAAEECEAVAAAMEESLIKVDPTCMTLNGFWETFRWDLANGDFPVEDLNQTAGQHGPNADGHGSGV